MKRQNFVLFLVRTDFFGDFKGFTSDNETMDKEKQVFFILFALHNYICVIRTFSLSGVPGPSSPEKRESSVLVFCE